MVGTGKEKPEDIQEIINYSVWQKVEFMDRRRCSKRIRVTGLAHAWE